MSNCIYSDHYYTPPLKMASLDFLKRILSGAKRMLPIGQVRHVNQAERYTELSVQSLLNYAANNMPQLFLYLPDNPSPERLCRKYLLNVTCLDAGHELP